MAARITVAEKFYRNCHAPKLIVKKKDCGCAVEVRCKTCGGVDKFPEEHHVAWCRKATRRPHGATKSER
jgi:hypothetical protein